MPRWWTIIKDILCESMLLILLKFASWAWICFQIEKSSLIVVTSELPLCGWLTLEASVLAVDVWFERLVLWTFPVERNCSVNSCRIFGFWAPVKELSIRRQDRHLTRSRSKLSSVIAQTLINCFIRSHFIYGEGTAQLWYLSTNLISFVSMSVSSPCSS